MDFTHFNKEGNAHMVDVGEKNVTDRVAVAEGSIKLTPEIVQRIMAGSMKKGDVIGIAQIAGIMGAKKTSDLIPMCHNIFIAGADLKFDIDENESRVYIEATVKTSGKTGVEMEALTAVSVAALTIYDMCKAIDKGMVIESISLKEKSGGKSGHYKKD